MIRKNLLINWLKNLYNGEQFVLEFAAADADFRRYFRAKFITGKTIICMDAPPDKMSIVPFIRVQKIFSCVHVPHIFAYDEKLGFMALEDLGVNSYLDVMLKNHDLNLHSSLLVKAIQSLVSIQKSSQANVLPIYDDNILLLELNLFKDWYIEKHLNTCLTTEQFCIWNDTCRYLVDRISQQSKVYTHRDFIVRNLIVREDTPGILDFQDAVFGSIYYDILSLTKDAFIEWEEEFIRDILIIYWELAKKAKLAIDKKFDVCYENYAIIGVQRHLKVVGIFSRLALRDGKPKYLPEIPRIINYLNKTCIRYKKLHSLYRLIQDLHININ